MKLIFHILFCTIFILSCTNAQKQVNYKLVGAPCEGCEAIFEYGNKKLTATDTLPDFKDNKGEKLKVSGIIYHKDGKTPANNVILYFYHTDRNGLYTRKPNQTGLGKRHGYNRGWIKTDKTGKYSFYTVKPGIYPDRASPAHIHLTVLEPNGNYYYLHDFYFKGDPLLTEKELKPKSPRGGYDGVLDITKNGHLQVASQNIILGKNIPDYE
jgi:protocatechuate 3,4-dioxygenase, beta subunit